MPPLLAGVGAGLYRDLDDAVTASVRVVRVHPPNPDAVARLDAGYHRHRQVVEAMAGLDLDDGS